MHFSVSVLLAAVLWAVAGLSVASTIYQCEENGRKVFSQQPCGADATEIKTAGARTVDMRAGMPYADIQYLCSLAMRSWEKQAIDQRNRTSSYYGRSSSGSSEERRQAFVLSHIRNLEKIAADDPELYDIAKSISRRSYYGRGDDYAYDAERARAEKACVSDVGNSIDRVVQRRRAQDEREFGRR